MNGSILTFEKELIMTSTTNIRENHNCPKMKSYEVTGRIVPERCDVEIKFRKVKVIMSDSETVIVSFTLLRSYILSNVESVKDLNVYQISDIVESAIRPFVDRIAFFNKCYYNIVLDTIVNLDTRRVDLIPVSEPFLSKDVDGFLFKKFKPPFGIDGAVSNAQFCTALHDLSQAVRFSQRTFEYCQMALEAIRHDFEDKKEKNWKKRKRNGLSLMEKKLKISDCCHKFVEKYAAPARHGKPIEDYSWELRQKALTIGWEVTYRFQLYLENKCTESWLTFNPDINGNISFKKY